jgi:anti-sigma-K factor RskA
MSRRIKRYQVPEIIDHLASNYVLGTLSTKVKNRVEKLRLDFDHKDLNTRIQFWEKCMSPLNEKVPPLQPKLATWEKIQQELNFSTKKTSKKIWYNLLSPKFYQWATVCSLLFIALFSVNTFYKEPSIGSLSYVAVLADDKQQPQLVAATYGDSQTLLLDIVKLPVVASGEILELWVISKTDKQARSLGEIPLNVANVSRKLNDAQWRLIKDSDSLMISIEETGGSPIGEPTGQIISRGACIRLSAWQTQV